MSYTVGNWTVSEQTTDTITTAKTPSIPDLSYAADYTVTKKMPDEVQLANVTGSGLIPAETLRYGRTKIADVYANANVPESQKCNVKGGIRTLAEVQYFLKATNTVSGEEVILPMRGWMCLQVPTVDFISSAALQTLLKRTIAASFGTGEAVGTQAVSVARGDLDPTA
jgi:hypothetical protein